MLYIRNFETRSDYEAAKLNLAYPNVSACDDEPFEVFYNLDPYNDHDYVEIGGLKWATMNIGASGITDGGLYFQWGDTQGYTAEQVGSGSGKKYFGWEDYKFGNGTSTPGNSGMTKYNSTDGKTILGLEDDAARANMGGEWRMPTSTELKTLGNAVNTAWTNDYQSSGIKGLVCTAKDGSGAELFFPAVGLCGNGSVYYVGNGGYYWSSSLSTSYPSNTYFLHSYDVGTNWSNVTSRYYGCTVRGVVG